MYVEPTNARRAASGQASSSASRGSGFHFLTMVLTALTFTLGTFAGVYIAQKSQTANTFTETQNYQAAASYEDISPSYWAAAPIGWVTSAGIMKAPDATPNLFDPGGVVNRASLAVVTTRLYDKLHRELSDVQKAAKSAETTKTILVTLDGKMTGVNTDMKGAGMFILKGNVLWYSVSVENNTSKIAAGHLHGGGLESEDTIIRILKFSGPVTQGTVTLTDAERQELLSGKVFLNIHTTAYPNGEIGGVLVPEKSL